MNRRPITLGIGALAALRVTDEHGEALPHDAWATEIALRTGRPVYGLVACVEPPHGVRRWLQIDAMPLPDLPGQPRRVAATFLDITAVRDEQERAQRLASIVEQSSDAVVGVDLDGVVEIWNAAAERLYGYTAAEMLGQPMQRILLPEEAARFPERLRRIRAGERLSNREVLRLRFLHGYSAAEIGREADDARGMGIMLNSLGELALLSDAARTIGADLPLGWQ